MGQKTNPIGNRLGIIRGWTQTGMVEMITVIKSPKITKSESISMLVYQNKCIKNNYRENFKLVTVTITTARPGIIIGKGGQEVDKLKKNLRKLLTKRFKSTSLKLKDLNLMLIWYASIARQIESRISYRQSN